MNIKDLPNIIPIFPLSGALLLPKGNLPLNIFESRYISMIDFSMKTNKMIGMIQENKNSVNTNGLYSVGCLGKITQYNETVDGRYLINLNGIMRFNIFKEEKTNEKFRKLEVNYTKFLNDLNHGFEDSFNKKIFLKEVKIYLLKNNIEVDWNIIKNINQTVLITALASICPFSVAEKQMILECKDVKEISNTMLSLFKMGNESLLSNNIN